MLLLIGNFIFTQEQGQKQGQMISEYNAENITGVLKYKKEALKPKRPSGQPGGISKGQGRGNDQRGVKGNRRSY